MSTNKNNEIDKKYMQIAIELAKKGAGTVNPNPMVGAVVVQDEKVIGTGYHKYFGGPHAEVYALEEAAQNSNDLSNATIYVTLEPCSHYGKTPPCAEKIVKMGLKRCVIGSSDPNPKVAGKGVQILRNAGIEVCENVLKSECDKINQVFFKYIMTKIPYLFLKCAITLDGKIATKTGNSKWITNEIAREKVQFYRNKFMGIMVGINTVLADNPSLTARVENGINPYRIIIDPHFKTGKNHNIIKENSDEKTIIVTSKNNENSEKQLDFSENSKVKFIFLNGTKFSFKEILYKIGEIGIDSVLLEGGQSLISQAFKESLIDAGEIFIANKILGDEKGKSFITGFDKKDMNEAVILKNVKYNIYGENVGMEFLQKNYN